MKEDFLIKLRKLFPKHIRTYTDSQFICSKALEHGAVKAITISSEVDFNFDSKGNLVGINTQYRDSFVAVKKRKK